MGDGSARERLRQDYRLLRAALQRERGMRARVLRGEQAARGVAEMDAALAALRRLGEALALVLDGQAAAAEQPPLFPTGTKGGY